MVFEDQGASLRVETPPFSHANRHREPLPLVTLVTLLLHPHQKLTLIKGGDYTTEKGSCRERPYEEPSWPTSLMTILDWWHCRERERERGWEGEIKSGIVPACLCGKGKKGLVGHHEGPWLRSPNPRLSPVESGFLEAERDETVKHIVTWSQSSTRPLYQGIVKNQS